MNLCLLIGFVSRIIFYFLFVVPAYLFVGVVVPIGFLALNFQFGLEQLAYLIRQWVSQAVGCTNAWLVIVLAWETLGEMMNELLISGFEMSRFILENIYLFKDWVVDNAPWFQLPRAAGLVGF